MGICGTVETNNVMINTNIKLLVLKKIYECKLKRILQQITRMLLQEKKSAQLVKVQYIKCRLKKGYCTVIFDRNQFFDLT